MPQIRHYNILLIEDNPGDIRLTQEAFRDSKNDIELEAVMDGTSAIHYLKKLPPYEDKKQPDLILLDLNIPKQNGKEVLSFIKQDNELRRIPVVVLTTSKAEIDVIKSYDLHANCFINKPIDVDSFFDLIIKIEEFWLSTIILPSETY